MNLEYREDFPDYHHHLQATAPPPGDGVTQFSPSSEKNQPVRGESKTPEGDNTVTLERQPICAQVKGKSEKENEDANHDSEEAKQTKEEAETVQLLSRHFLVLSSNNK